MTKKRVSEVLRLSLLDAQKCHGFQKKGNLYVRQVGEISHMIDVQASQWNGPEQQVFTVNCGIYVPGVMSVFRTAPEPKQPKVTECCISARIGMLQEPPRDIWWKIYESDGPERDGQIAQEIATVVTASVLPFLGRFGTTLQVAEFLSLMPLDADKFVDPRVGGYRFSYAALLWRKLGDEKKFSTYIEQARQSSKKTPLESFVEAFAIRCQSNPEPR